MKSKNRLKISEEIANLIPNIISAWRRFKKLPGPEEELQTREFRATCALLQTIETAYQSASLPEDFYSRDVVATNLLYHFPLHYGQGLSLLSELPKPPRKVLEIGSGSAPFSLAALRLGAKDVCALDASEDALRLGSEVIGRLGYPISMRQYEYGKTPFPFAQDERFDLIMLPYSIYELIREEDPEAHSKRCRLVDSLLKKLTPDGHLLLVDRTEPYFNTGILKIRDHCVNDGIAVQAPCVYKGFCPALASKSPCYAQREFEKPYFIKELQRGADIFLNSLKMSYVIFKSPDADWPDLQGKPYYRIISPPVESYQGKRYYLCGRDGKEKLDMRLDEKSYTLQRGSLILLENSTKYTHVLAPGKPLSDIPYTPAE
jgi:SAM-dependent methyltransferase